MLIAVRRRFTFASFLVPVLMALVVACGDGDGGGLDSGYPSAGEDRFELTRATIEIEYTFDSVAASPFAGALERIELEGPALVTRSDPQDEDGDGRVEVVTEIVGMELSGTASFGPLTVRVNPDKRSTGMVEQQQPGEDFPADSFFDVFVQVELPSSQGGTTVIGLNEEPLRMEAELTDLPPGEGDEYRTASGEPVPLVAANDATLRLGRIVDALHTPNPPPGPGARETPEETPEATPTEEPQPTPTEEPSAQQVDVQVAAGCEHPPGVQSDLVALVLAHLVGATPQSSDLDGSAPMVIRIDGSRYAGPAGGAALGGEVPLAGATIVASAQGPGVIEGTQSAVTDDEGAARLRFPINLLGQYIITVVSVTAADGTELEFAEGSQTTVTFEVMDLCTLPFGF